MPLNYTLPVDCRAPDSPVIAEALAEIEARFANRGPLMQDPEAVRSWLKLNLATAERELFTALWLDNQHHLIRHEVLATGTINAAAVYPREVVKAALRCNAAAVIFAHNHPSGCTKPSRADEALTRHLVEALALVEVRTLDHFIVGAGACFSFAEAGALLSDAEAKRSEAILPPTRWIGAHGGISKVDAKHCPTCGTALTHPKRGRRIYCSPACRPGHRPRQSEADAADPSREAEGTREGIRGYVRG